MRIQLVIIHNHKFESNIEKLNMIYSERFDNIIHLVPFYQGLKKNVISIYENSLNFSGYVAQAHNYLKDIVADHFLFIADDMLLNPLVTQFNYSEYFKVDENTNFIPYLFTLDRKRTSWSHGKSAINFKLNFPRINSSNELPNFNDAIKLFESQNLSLNSVHFKTIHNKPSLNKGLIKYIFYYVNIILKTRYKLSYPLAASYSDIFLVNKSELSKFSHFCGIFAASRLFVEIAIPTALVLSSEKLIRMELDLDLSGKAFWPDGYFRLTHGEELVSDDVRELESLITNFEQLLQAFPKKYLYIHPIKLSKIKL